MKVNVKLIKHQIDLKLNIRVLKIQLNFKLKWATYMHHVEAKLVIKQKIMQTIIEFIWDLSMTMSKQIYFAMMHLLLSHEVIIWYTSQKVKDHWKNFECQAEISIRKSIATDHQCLLSNINRNFTDENEHDVDKYSLIKIDTKINNKHELLKIRWSYQDNNALNSQ